MDGLPILPVSLALAVVAAALLLILRFRRRPDPYAALMRSSPDGVLVVDGEWRLKCANAGAQMLLPLDLRTMRGRFIHEMLDELAPDLRADLRRAQRSGEPHERTVRAHPGPGWLELRVTRYQDDFVFRLRDVTERRNAEEALHESDRRLRLLLAQIPAALWTVDRKFELTSVTGAGAHAGDGTVPAILETSRAELERAISGEAVRSELQHGGRWLQNDIEPLRDLSGDIVGAVGLTLDVSEVRQNSERFARMARQDAMTELPNRLALDERLPQLLDRAVERHESVAVLFVDLDRFKTINDTLGHRAGDALLRSVGRRLSERLDEDAAIFRPGGDEFVVVLSGVAHKRTVAASAMNVLNAFSEPFVLEGRELFVTASVGASTFPHNAQTPDELIAFADSAMYRAKEAGRNNAKFYDGTMHAHVLERMGLEQDLRQALSRNELELVYQPIVEVASRRVVAAEALLRWRHPLLGELLPASFIAIAEETGAIVAISRWVLQEACSRAAALRERIPDFRIAVNLSSRDFFEPEFPSALCEILAHAGLPPGALDVEVTESVMLNDVAVTTLARIAGLGVRVVIDDFGTGYSSLSYIKRLPVDAIKVDKAFIDDVTRDAYDQGIVKAIATLGQTLGLRVIAEGIESEAQWEFVRSLRCDQAQGYYFQHPVGFAQLVDVLAEYMPVQRSGNVIPFQGAG